MVDGFCLDFLVSLCGLLVFHVLGSDVVFLSSLHPESQLLCSLLLETSPLVFSIEFSFVLVSWFNFDCPVHIVIIPINICVSGFSVFRCQMLVVCHDSRFVESLPCLLTVF